MNTKQLSVGRSPSVLVVHTWGIGDWMMFTPTLRALKHGLPNCEIDVLVGTPPTSSIVRLFGEVRSIYRMNVRSGIVNTILAGIDARSRRYDILIFTDGVAGWKTNLFSFLVGASKHVTPVPRKSNELSDAKLLYKLHRVARNLNLLDALGIERPPTSQPFLENRWGEPRSRSVLIHPGGDSNRSFKRWPTDRFVTLARALLADSYKVTVVLGPSEADLRNDFGKGLAGTDASILTNHTMEEVVAEIAKHELCLSSDSGIGHIAAALGRRVITIFGPADPDVVRPFSYSSTVVQTTDKSLRCMPCIRPGGRMGCPERPCLMQIEVAQVLSAIRTRISIVSVDQRVDTTESR